MPMLSQSGHFRADEDSILETVQAVLGALDAPDIEDALSRLQTIDAGIHTALYAYLTGLVATRLGEYGKAIELMDEAHRLAPDAPEPIEVLAALHGHLGAVADSLYFLKLSTTLSPSSRATRLLPEWIGSPLRHFLDANEAPLLTRARQRARRHDFAAAVDFYRQHLETDAADAGVWRELARTSLRAGQPFDAAMALHAVSDLDGMLTAADHALIAEILCACGQAADGLEHYYRTLRSDPGSVACWPPVLAALADSHPVRALVLGEEAWWARTLHAQLTDVHTPPTRRPVRTAPDSLRIGLVCGRADPAGPLDLFIRAVSQAAELPWHLVTYAQDCPDNEISRRAAAASRTLVNTTAIDTETLLTIVRNDELDVLIDLDGARFAGRPELGLLADVPLRLLYLGQPEAASLRGFDGILGDRFGSAAADGSLLILTAPLISAWDIAPAPPRPAPCPLVGCWARPADVTHDELLCWSAILEAHPEARIKLPFRTIGGPAGAANLLERAAPRIGADRIVFSDEAPAEFVRELACLLDPAGRSELYPALLALSAGVPVIIPSSRAPCDTSLEVLAAEEVLPLRIAADNGERAAQARALLTTGYLAVQPGQAGCPPIKAGHQLFSTLIEGLRRQTRRIEDPS
jgi:tetratricopeptide (TPR) repeat protein